jgi:hypothetical protein
MKPRTFAIALIYCAGAFLMRMILNPFNATHTQGIDFRNRKTPPRPGDNLINLFKAWNKLEKAEEWRVKLSQIEDL